MITPMKNYSRRIYEDIRNIIIDRQTFCNSLDYRLMYWKFNTNQLNWTIDPMGSFSLGVIWK